MNGYWKIYLKFDKSPLVNETIDCYLESETNFIFYKTVRTKYDEIRDRDAIYIIPKENILYFEWIKKEENK